MSLPANIEEISTKVRGALGSSPGLQFSDFRPLVGGNANYVFLGRLADPIPQDIIPPGTSDVIIKHGEDYVSSNPDFPLPTSRCTAEAETLQAIGKSGEVINGHYRVCTPNLYFFSPGASTHVQEYLQDAINLKQYVLKYYEPQTPRDKQPQCFGIGDCLGRWLKSFHQWAVLPQQAALWNIAAANKHLQQIKNATYYEYLVNLIDKFPGLLSGNRELFQTLRALAEEELRDDGNLQPCHGDFWTGNILIPDRAITDTSSQTPMFVVDWEVVSLGMPIRDVGQMVAEMWMHKLFKGIDAGEWLVKGFLAGYGALGDDRAFRAAIHVGCHLVVIGGTVAGWGSPEDVTRVVSFGRDMMVKGYEKDVAWFKGGPLDSMFKSA